MSFQTPILQTPILMSISDPVRSGPLPLFDALLQAAEGGAQLIQIRQRGWSTKEVYGLAHKLQGVLPSSAHLVINDRVDLALAVGAAGVHLPEHGLPIAQVRKLVGHHRLIGRSVHSLSSALSAAKAGADYLVVGTMFPTNSKPGKIPEGPRLLEAIREKVELPLIAVGGIRTENIPTVQEAGADGVAVIGAILESTCPKKAACALISMMLKHSK